MSSLDSPGGTFPALDPDVQDGLSVALIALGEARLDGEHWRRAEELLREIGAAVSAGDNAALRRLITRLEMVMSRRRGPGADRGPIEPAPAGVRAGVRRVAVLGAGLAGPASDDAVPGSVGRGPEPGAAGQPRVRYVNSVLARAGTEEPVPLGRPLAPATRYDLLVNIGAARPGSLLPASEHARWPDEPLPDGDLRLRAVLRLDGMPRPLAVTLTLPRWGESFACECPPDGEHLPRCAPTGWARFAVTTPDRECRWRGELIIYYQVVAVHAQRLDLPAGGPAAEGPRATMLYRLTTSFSNLRPLADRSASILLAPGEGGLSSVTVNGLRFAGGPVSVAARAADEAYHAARYSLYTRQVTPEPAPALLYDAGFGKGARAFEADLRVLARVGAAVYQKVFGDTGVGNLLQALIRQEAGLRQRPPVLCVADAAGSHASDPGIPWSLLYDLPVGANPDDYTICESVAMFGPGGGLPGGTERGAAPVPMQCPVGHTGQTDVVCPWGFWGLSSVLEQPPSITGDASAVVTSAAEPPAVLFAAGTGLDPDITTRHLTTLRTDLGDALQDVQIRSKDALATALDEERLDVAYLYCHCDYQYLTPESAPSQLLRFGDARIGPLDVTMWARANWSNPHWPTRKPLIVLNGCHTVEVSTATLSSFVEAFVQNAGASGVLGSEVAMEQGLASRVLETFLRWFAAGASVGEALREVRWDLFRRGNVMGLAYTAYCLSGLRLRPLAPAGGPVVDGPVVDGPVVDGTVVDGTVAGGTKERA